MACETPPHSACGRHPDGDPAATDEALLAALAGRDPAALGLLYDRHSGSIYGLAYRILADHGAAEEVVQDVFLRAWRAADNFRGARGSARNWLLALAHHRAIDLVRRDGGRARRTSWLDDVPPPPDPRGDLWAAVDERLLREQLRRTLGLLPPVQRQAVELAYFGGHTAAEIAARQGVPLGTAMGRLRLGLRALQRDLAHLAPAELTRA